MAKTDVIVYGQGESPQWGTPPAAPTQVTSYTYDSGASVAFLPPTNLGSGGAISSYTVTPYIGASAQTPTTVNLASTTSISGAYNGDSTVYRRVAVSGLTNSTAYTFTVKATNSAGTSVESTASGANTPLAGLVYGDDFNGPANAAPDPEWWVYDRCGFIAQNEVQWYKPTHCVLDGTGRLRLRTTPDAVSGTSYPSDGNVTRNQTCKSGACQSNTKTWYPATGHTMTYEARLLLSPNSGGNLWPGFFWLNGQYALDAWKTDPGPNQWNSTNHAEIDVAEWNQTGSPNNYQNVTWAGGSQTSGGLTGANLATQMHTFDVVWDPGSRVTFHRDGAQTFTTTNEVPASGAQFVLLLYLQMYGANADESIYCDWVRVYQN